jgi:hypothetical protein
MVGMAVEVAQQRVGGKRKGRAGQRRVAERCGKAVND